MKKWIYGIIIVVIVGTTTAILLNKDNNNDNQTAKIKPHTDIQQSSAQSVTLTNTNKNISGSESEENNDLSSQKQFQEKFNLTPGGLYLGKIKEQFTKQLDYLKENDHGEILKEMEKMIKKFEKDLKLDKMTLKFEQRLKQELSEDEIKEYFSLMEDKSLLKVNDAIRDLLQYDPSSQTNVKNEIAEPSSERRLILKDLLQEGVNPQAHFEMGYYLSAYMQKVTEPESFETGDEFKSKMEETFLRFYDEKQEEMVQRLHDRTSTLSLDELKRAVEIQQNSTYRRGTRISNESAVDHFSTMIEN